MGLLTMTSAVERARTDLAKLTEARATLEAEELRDTARLAELRIDEANAELEALINGTEPSELRVEIFRIEQAIRRRALVRPKLLGRIHEAVLALAHAEADVIRASAKKKQKALDAHVAKEAELRKALEEFEGCPYVRDLLPRASDGTRVASPLSATPVWVPQSKTLTLRAEIAELLARADQIEAHAQDGLRGGIVSGYSLTELLTAVADNPLAPTRAEVEAWFAEADRAAATDFASEFPGAVFRAEQGHLNTSVANVARETTFRLAWTPEGRVDPAASGWLNRAKLQSEAA